MSFLKIISVILLLSALSYSQTFRDLKVVKRHRNKYNKYLLAENQGEKETRILYYVLYGKKEIDSGKKALVLKPKDKINIPIPETQEDVFVMIFFFNKNNNNIGAVSRKISSKKSKTA